MSLSKEEIKVAALQLDPVEREALAEELLLSIDANECDEIDAAWLSEVRRRDADFAAGKTSARPAHAIIDRLKNKVRQ